MKEEILSSLAVNATLSSEDFNKRRDAAAPEMYEALRLCEVELAPDGHKGNVELWQKIRTTLVKIEGRG